MKPIRELYVGSQAVSWRDRRSQGRPRPASIIGDEEVVAVNGEPVVMAQEGKLER
jgi:hypothetical protein